MTKFKVFSLFSGAGGLDLGFEISGMFQIIFGNDISEPATETFSNNFGAQNLLSQPRSSELPAVYQGDISNLDLEQLANTTPDVVCGGPPCQDFSVVRGPESERSGIKVSRGRLYSHFVRALLHLQPKIFVFENVPGLKSSNQGQAYDVILDDFSNLNLRWKEIKKIVGNQTTKTAKGYEIIYCDIVDASNLGVPQARRRLIIIGLRKDLVPPWWKLAGLKEKIARSLKNGNQLISKYPLTPLEVFQGRTLPDLNDEYAMMMEQFGEIVKEVKTPVARKWKKDEWDRLQFQIIDDYLLLNQIKPKNSKEIDTAFENHETTLKELGYFGVNIQDLASQDGSNSIPNEAQQVVERMKRIPPGANHEFVRGTKWMVEGRGMSLIYRRIHPLKPSYTLVAHGGGGTWGYHYDKSRSKLTNRERARLQTFPDKFLFSGNSSQIRSQIGEAVPVLMAKRIAENVTTLLQKT